MKTHILLTLITAAILTACASKEHVSPAKQEQFETSKYETIDGPSGRVR